MAVRDEHKNIRYYCQEHAPQPDTRLHQFPAAAFIGCHVKRAFHFDGGAEHMWLKVLETDGEMLVGRLDNEPQNDVGCAYGDVVRFAVTEVEALHDGSELKLH